MKVWMDKHWLKVEVALTLILLLLTIMSFMGGLGYAGVIALATLYSGWRAFSTWSKKRSLNRKLSSQKDES